MTKELGAVNDRYITGVRKDGHLISLGEPTVTFESCDDGPEL